MLNYHARWQIYNGLLLLLSIVLKPWSSRCYLHNKVPSNLYYKPHKIQTLKCFSSHLCSIHLSQVFTHWGRVTHICVSKLTIIGPDNGLSPDRRQAIIWTNAGILLIGPLGTNFSEISIEILTFSFKKMRLKLSSAKRRPFVLASKC